MKKAAPTDPRQPKIIQLAAALFEDERRVQSFAFIIKPTGFEIPEEVSAIHGISTSFARTYGIPWVAAADKFDRLLSMADQIVGHNVAFDINLLGLTELYYNTHFAFENIILSHRRVHCTADMSTPICRLPPTQRMRDFGFNTFKRAKLSEAYEHFFKRPLLNAHDALVDLDACAQIFFHIKQMEKQSDGSTVRDEPGIRGQAGVHGPEGSSAGDGAAEQRDPS